MRKLGVVVICFALLEMVSCSLVGGSGKVVFKLPGNGALWTGDSQFKSISSASRYADASGRAFSDPAALMEVPSKYVVSLSSGPDKAVVYNKEHLAGEVISIEDLAPGKYEVSVSGVQDHGDYRFVGSDSVTVVAGKSASAKISLETKTKLFYYVSTKISGASPKGTGTKEDPYNSINTALLEIGEATVASKPITFYVLDTVGACTINQKANILIEGVGDNAKVYATGSNIGFAGKRPITLNGNLADTKVALKNIKITNGSPNQQEGGAEYTKGGGIGIFGGELTLLDNVEICGNMTTNGKEIYLGPASNAKLTINGNVNIHPAPQEYHSEVGSDYHSIYIENDNFINLGKNANFKTEVLFKNTYTNGQQIYKGDSETLKRCYGKIRFIHQDQNKGYYITPDGKVATRYTSTTLNELKSFPEELMILADSNAACQSISTWLFENASALGKTPIDLYIAQAVYGEMERDWSFSNCEANIKKLTLNCSSTPRSSFAGCKYIETIVITPNINQINENTFADCSNITNLYMQNNYQWKLNLNKPDQEIYTPTHNPILDAKKFKDNADKKWSRQR